jgi:urease accessory protein
MLLYGAFPPKTWPRFGGAFFFVDPAVGISAIVRPENGPSRVTMLRISNVLPAKRADLGRVVDAVILDSAQRRVHRGVLAGTSGAQYAVDLAEPVALRMGNFLVLDDGGLIEVVAEAEPLIEVREKNPDALARLAWHLGDRHVPVEVLANRLRMRRDPAIETLLAALGAKWVAIEAPFNPEGGAYVVGHGDHHHDHDHHGHDHHHGHHHDHDHDHDH